MVPLDQVRIICSSVLLVWLENLEFLESTSPQTGNKKRRKKEGRTKFLTIFLSHFSGARIGLAKEIQEVFKVVWSSPGNPKGGFDYLYLLDKDYQKLLEQYGGKKTVEVEKREGPPPGVESEKDEKFHWLVTDVIGATDGLGVENLQGSGLIAGETSRAYDETFTITLVTGGFFLIFF